MIILPGQSIDSGGHVAVRAQNGFSSGVARVMGSSFAGSSSLPAVVVAAQATTTSGRKGGKN